MYSTALKSTSPSALKCEWAIKPDPGYLESTWKNSLCSSSVTSLGSRSHSALASFKTVSFSLIGKLMNSEYVLTRSLIFDSCRYSSAPSLTRTRISVPRVRLAANASSPGASKTENVPVPADSQTYGGKDSSFLLTT